MDEKEQFRTLIYETRKSFLNCPFPDDNCRRESSTYIESCSLVCFDMI